MPEFRSTRTGVVVSVAEADTTALGPEYEPVEKPKPKRTTK